LLIIGKELTAVTAVSAHQVQGIEFNVSTSMQCRPYPELGVVHYLETSSVRCNGSRHDRLHFLRHHAELATHAIVSLVGGFVVKQVEGETQWMLVASVLVPEPDCVSVVTLP
jgi:hypothetical protein